MKKVVCAMENPYEISAEQADRIKNLCWKYGYETVFCQRDEAYEHAPDAEVIYAYDPKLLTVAEEVKWFASTWAGVNAYLSGGALRKGTVLTNARGCFGVTIAEHMITVLLMMMRRIPEHQENLRRGVWRHDQQMETLYGKNVLVIGIGDIGSRFARLARAFEPKKIVGVNRSGRDAGPAFDETRPASELDELLPDADVIAMALPETGETRNTLSRERIAMLKESAYVVNVGRGTSIDEDALAEALNAGKVAGAALDVFRVEPLPEDAPIHNAKNVLITPHCAGQMGAEITRELHVQLFLDNLERYFNGEELRNVIDPAKGY